MKALFALISALFMLTTTLPVFGAAVCQPAPAGLVGWWPGEGNANDIAGSATGTLQGGATATVAGEVGQAFSFNGTNGYVSIPDSPVLHPANLTIEAWVRFSSLNSVGAGGSPAGDQYLVFKQNTRSGDFESFDLSKTRLTGGDVFRFLVTSASGQTAEIDSATFLATNVWYHVAAVRGSNFTQLYVNGQLERQMTVSFPQDYGALPLYFGTSGQTYWDHKFSGSMDEVSLYNRALASNEIAAIYAAGAAGKCKGASGPSITVQPLSQTVAAGVNVGFNVTASGTAPLSYQWRLNGGALAGATNPSLLLANVQLVNAGNYSVVVSNSLAAVTSMVAVLTVLTPPAITSQPQSLANNIGSTANFSSTATGSAPLGYQWQQNGVSLANSGRVSGATTNTLTISNLQPADAGNYLLLVSNGAGTVTSTVAVLTVIGPPVILTQPVSQDVVAGANVNFNVTASGTAPVNYQWQKAGVNLGNGGNVSGATGPMLTLASVGANDAGGYRVVVANVAGSSNSTVATLTVTAQAPSGPVQAGAIVLVNSRSAKYLDFQHFVQPYLDNFGVPYAVQDIAVTAVGTNIANYALIIIGHSQLDPGHLYLDSAGQTRLSTAVFNGTGLVSFDNALSVGTSPTYQFVQDIFGFTYSAASSVNTVTFPATEPSAQLHYVTSLHQANESLSFYANMSQPGLTLPAKDTAIALGNGKPLTVITKYGEGRAIQWATADWMSVNVLGPVNGLDDLLWRGFVWAARKPFVMRGMPNFATMRVDDASGPFTWVHTANQTGFKPYIAIYFSNVSNGDADDLRGLVTSGNATTSIHSFDCCNFFYFDHNNGVPYSDSVIANNFAKGTAWHTSHGIPISKMMIPHWSEIGPNAFAGLKAWGVEYVLIEVVPGTREYFAPYPDWLTLGPYRRYETPLAGQSLNPMVYADFLPIPGHSELNGQFFDPYTEIRNVAPSTIQQGGDWAPTTDVAGSVDRGYKQIKRGLDSLTLGNVFTHENPYIYVIPNATWLAIVQGVAAKLAPYNPSYVTMDYANQYLRATRTSTLVAAAYDPVTGLINATLAGKTDLPINLYVYSGADSSITSTPRQVPVFNGNTTVTFGSSSASALAVPLVAIRLQPGSQAPQLIAPYTQNGEVVLSLIGEPGRICRIEGSPDLVNWIEIKTVTLLDGTTTVSEPITAGNHFYRAIVLQ